VGWMGAGEAVQEVTRNRIDITIKRRRMGIL
jgi:hypothetical protein